MITVGLCEDDDEFRGVVRAALEAEGFAVIAVALGADAVRRFVKERPDLLVLDIGLPDADGRDVLTALRARDLMAPVLFLTARDALPDRLSGYRAGADDYLIKPVSLAELVVRVQALLRRMGPGHVDMILDPHAHAVVHGDARVPLTPTEYRLLARLLANRGQVVSRGGLFSAGWPDGTLVHDNTLDVNVVRIRRKLGAAGVPVRISTVRGIGHVLE